MDLSVINWWAVLINTVLCMVSGSLWYTPKTFFNTWYEGLDKKEQPQGSEEEMKRSMMVAMGIAVLTSFILAVTMAILVPLFSASMSAGKVTIFSGVMTGFMLWLGIIVPTNLVNKIFGGFKPVVFFIEVGNHLLNMVLFGIVIALFA